MSDTAESPEQNGDVSPAAAPFEPWYQVQVISATKNGETVVFDVNTKKLEAGGDDFTVQRIFDDFEWLQHSLTTENDVGGIIVPPLPPRPGATAADAAAKSKKELGNQTKTVKGDEFHKDCRRLEKYLQGIVRHHILGKDKTLGLFLLEKEAPTKAKLKKSLLDSLSKTMGEVRKAGHRDVDATFQKERDTVNEMVELMRDASISYNNKTYHVQRQSGALNHLSTALCLCNVSASDGPAAQVNQLQAHFAKAVDHCAHAAEVFAANDEQTLGFTLDLYARFVEAEKEMLYRRTCKLVEFDQASKNAEKAKPPKKAWMEEVKRNREKDLIDISDVAKKEISQFHRQRVIEFQKSLILYAEAQVKTARDLVALLAKDISTIKQLVPQDPDYKPLY